MFDETRMYRVGDKALDVIAHPSTLARWRMRGTGPSYTKLGARIAYTGAALNEWLRTQTITPQGRREAETGAHV